MNALPADLQANDVPGYAPAPPRVPPARAESATGEERRRCFREWVSGDGAEALDFAMDHPDPLVRRERLAGLEVELTEAWQERRQRLADAATYGGHDEHD